MDAPSNVRVGEAFEVKVVVEAPAGVRHLSFAVGYDKKRLKLAGVTEGSFAHRGAPPAEFAKDEPSEGSILVSFAVRDDLWVAGAGSIAVLQFEAIKAGVLAITAEELTTVDGTGARGSRVAKLSEATVTVD